MTTENTKVPQEFSKVIRDLVKDVVTTFPEYEPLVNKWWKTKEHFNNIEDEEERNSMFEKEEAKTIEFLFEYCQKKIPPRFFDILYQNNDIFNESSDTDTEFLPNIHFKNLWQCEITDKTRDTIWKYLQLIMFSVVGSLQNKEAFGDTAKMFEAINEDDFKSKLEETMTQIQGLFDLSGNFDLNSNFDLSGNFNEQNTSSGIPDPQQMHDHISGMLEGKLGNLAREIAEETATNLNIDFEDSTNMKDIFQKLLKDPSKLMGLVKNVGNKLDSKIKSGELKESELITEATEIMNKMKNMPGMGNIQSMLSKMGMSGKANTAAMESNLNQKMKMAKTKERIRAKAEANAKAKLEKQMVEQNNPKMNQNKIPDEELLKLFNSSEKIEKTPRGSKPEQQKKNNNKNKKK